MADQSQELPQLFLLPRVANSPASRWQPAQEGESILEGEEIGTDLSAARYCGTAAVSETSDHPTPVEKVDTDAPIPITRDCLTAGGSGSVLENRELEKSLVAFRPDPVARGVAIFLTLAGLQRLIGFVRAVWFCRYLPAEELGKWEILFSFLNLAAPLVIFSLPGAFGRYAERYRGQAQLRSFLRQTALVCAALTAIAAIVLFAIHAWLDRLLFAAAGADPLAELLPWTLASIITLNYLTELFTSLRNARISALLFFLNSVLFAVLGVALLLWWRSDALAVTAAYALSNLLTAGIGLGIVRRNYRLLPAERIRLRASELWGEMLPLAFSVWIINLATNLFTIVDRYLIVHLNPSGSDAALTLVGQYHSARLLPLLLLSLFQMLASMILPYMSADWEAAELQRARYRLRLALKLLALGMTGVASLLLVGSPLLFHTALGDKFQAGQQVLPGTLIYCIWFGLTLVAQNYLWCAEKPYLAALALALALATNVNLNIWFFPRWGLPGLVVGTSLAHLAALVMTLLWTARLGFRPDKTLLGLLLLPVSLLAGPAGALAILLLVVAGALLTGTLFTAEEKKLLQEGLLDKLGRWSWLFFMARRPSTPEPLP